MKIVSVIKTSFGLGWMSRQVRAMVLRGHQVAVLLPDTSPTLGQQFPERGCHVRVAPTRFDPRRMLLLPLDVMRLRRVIKNEHPDIVFYQLWASATMARLATVGMRGVRRVHMIPGPLFLESPAVSLVEHVLARLDHRIVAGSEYTARLCIKLGKPAGAVSTIPYGADLKHLQPAGVDDRARARDGLGLKQDAFVAVMVAFVYGGKRLAHGGRPLKGHADLLAAWRGLRIPGREKHLLLVGSGFDAAGRKHRERLHELYDIDAAPDITWVETVDDVRPYYAAADVSVSPSLSDNHGAVVEASAMGVPSIVSSAGALWEVAQGSGWLFPPGDRGELRTRLVEAASVTSHELAERGRAARRRVEEEFDADACVHKLVSLLEREAELE